MIVLVSDLTASPPPCQCIWRRDTHAGVGASDPFDFVGETDADVGVVCVHGFTGTPYEMRYLGEALARAGFTTTGLRLPGHGTSIADLERSRWEDWASAVEREVDAMFRRRAKVVVVGQSLGGLLALHLAAHRRELTAVASLAAPLWFDGLAGLAARWLTGRHGERLQRWIPPLPKIAGSDVRDRRVRAENPGYRAVPTRAFGELVAFMRVVDAELPRIAAPVLVLHGRRDHTAPVACATRIAARTRTRNVRILPHSFHLIAVDVERDIVAAEVIDFVRRHAATSPGDSPCVT
ncbi:MAG TPA: alpha/beta fold hydrolase [Kofleriaceae bacterium]|nr:alpha/beta fold hydrolase [Kofleriaceae bacterium]